MKLRAKLDKEEKDQVNASKINDGEDVQGAVELQIGQEAAPNSSSGCCSML